MKLNKEIEQSDQVDIEFLKLISAKDSTEESRYRVYRLMADLSHKERMRDWAGMRKSEYESKQRELRKGEDDYRAAVQLSNKAEADWRIAVNRLEDAYQSLDLALRQHSPDEINAAIARVNESREAERNTRSIYRTSQEQTETAERNLRLKAHAENPDQARLPSAVARLLTGGAITAVPSLTGIIQNTSGAVYTFDSSACLVSKINDDFVRQIFSAANPAIRTHFLAVVPKRLVEYRQLDKVIFTAIFSVIATRSQNLMPREETPSVMNTIPNGDPFSLYEMDTELGNYQAGDGAKYRGRGYIWQVGRKEYEKLSVKLGLPNLLDEPEQLSDIDTAIRALLVDRI